MHLFIHVCKQNTTGPKGPGLYEVKLYRAMMPERGFMRLHIDNTRIRTYSPDKRQTTFEKYL